MRSAGRPFGLFACALFAFAARGAAQTSPTERLQVTGSSTCPSPEAVQAAILQLTSLERRLALPSVSRVIITNDGIRYRVNVTAEETVAARTYRDPDRDCERRARFAAVFAVLTLMPPELQTEAEAEARAAAEAAEQAPAEPALPSEPKANPTARARAIESEPAAEGPAESALETPPRADRFRAEPLVRLELTAAVDRGARVSQPAPGFGGELRAAVGRGTIAGLVTLGYFPRSELAEDAFVYLVRRVPASVGVRARAPVGRFELAADAGLGVLLVRTQGMNLVRPADDSAALLGLRAGLNVGLPVFGATGAVLGAHVFVWPKPLPIEATPRGSVGTLPAVWLGASFGMSLGL